MGSNDRWRQQVTPELAVVVDASMCIVLEITSADGSEVLGRATLSDCDRVTDKMELARVFVATSEDDWYSALARLRAARRSGRRWRC